jgi:hypothetical protein
MERIENCDLAFRDNTLNEAVFGLDLVLRTQRASVGVNQVGVVTGFGP